MPAITATNCSDAITIKYLYDFNTPFSIGETIVMVTATDACGNVSEADFTVEVDDNEVPVADLTDLPYLKGECSLVVIDVPSATQIKVTNIKNRMPTIAWRNRLGNVK